MSELNFNGNDLETGLVDLDGVLWFYDKENSFAHKIPREFLDRVGNELDIKETCKECGKTSHLWTLTNQGEDGLEIVDALFAHCEKIG